MKRNLTTLLALCLLLLAAILTPLQLLAQTAPANNDCVNAISLALNIGCSATSATTTGATQSLPACGAGGIADDDVWFKFTAAKSQHTIQVTSAAGFDAVIEVFSGSCGSLVSRSCVDNNSAGQNEMSHQSGLTAGSVYYIRVYHYKAGAGSGQFSICVTDPINDQCEGAIVLSTGPNCTPTNGTLQAATQSLPFCNSGIVGNAPTADDVWYKFTATGMGHAVKVMPSAGLYVVVEVFSGADCYSLNSLVCQRSPGYGQMDSVSVAPLVPGQEYYIRVYNIMKNPTTTTFSICVQNLSLDPGAICNNAISIPAIPFNSGMQTTCGKGDDYRNFLNTAVRSEDMVYRLDVTNAPVSYLVTLDKVPGATYATTPSGLGVTVYKGCPFPILNPTNYVGDAPIATESLADSGMITLNTNGTYYFVVENALYKGADCGQYTFQLKNTPPPPSNDECVNAINITVGSTCNLYNATSAYATLSRPGKIIPTNTKTNADDDVWFSFVAKSTHHQIKVSGSISAISVPPVPGYYAIVEFFNGSCGNLSSVSNNNNTNNLNPVIDATNLIPGQTYYFRVYHQALGWGNGIFNVCVTELPVNDECAGAITLPVAPLNTNPTPQQFTTIAATQSMPTCGDPRFSSADDDIWFKFTATSPFQSIKVQGLNNMPGIASWSVADMEVQLFSGNCSNLNSMVCMDRFGPASQVVPEEIKTTNLVPGTTYYLRVYTSEKDKDMPDFTILIQEDTPPAIGATCGTAIPVSAFPFSSGTLSTCNGQDNFTMRCVGNGSGGTSREMMFKLDVTNAPVSYQVTLSAKQGKKNIAVYKGCPSPAYTPTNCITGQYSGNNLNNLYGFVESGGLDSVRSEIYRFTTNGTYYIMVEDYLQTTFLSLAPCGEFKLEVDLAPAPPANDLCTNAIPIAVNTTCIPVTGTSAGATGTTLACSNTGYAPRTDDDVWYKFTATHTSILVTVQGSANYQPAVQLLSNNCTNPTILVCSEFPNTSGFQTLEANNLVIGTEYLIKVYDINYGYGATGQFTICLVSPPPARPAGSICQNAVPVPAVPFYSGAQTTCGSGNDYGLIEQSYLQNGTKYGAGEDFVYALTVTNAPVTYDFTLGGTGTMKGLRIYNGCPTLNIQSPVNNLIATGNDTSSTGRITFSTNSTYYLIIDTSPQPACSPFRLSITPVPGPVTNDECTGSQILAVNSTCIYTAGSTAVATQSMPTNCYQKSQFFKAEDVWYKFTAPNNWKVTASVIGSPEFIPTLEIFSDTCGALKPLECATRATSTNLTKDFYNLTPGAEYYLRIYNDNNPDIYNGFKQGSGRFNICLTSTNTQINASCQQAVSLPVSPAGVCNFTNGTTTGTQAPAGLPSCSGQADDNAWYSFTATSTRHRIMVNGSTQFDPVIQFFNGSCGSNFTTLYCQDNTSKGATETLDASNLTIGQTYFFRIYHLNPGWGSGDFSVCVQELPAPPLNDECNGAITMVSDTVCTSIQGSLVNATQSMVGCSGTTAKDVWYKFTAIGVENEITVTPDSLADLVTEVFGGSCTNLLSISCRDTAVTAGSEIIRATGFIPGQEYYVRVYGYNGKTGNGNFSICIKSTSAIAAVPQAITSAVFCAGQQFALPFTTYGTFGSGNVFEAELSNDVGSFAIPVVVGSKSGISSDTILVTLPAASSSGTNYKIRLKATTPNYTGMQLVPLTIHAIPAAVSVTTPAPYCLNEPIAPLTATGTNLKWYSNAQLTNQVGTGTSFTPPQNLATTTTYYVTQTANNCPSVATPVTVTIKPQPNASFSGLDTLYCVSAQPVILQPTVAGGSFSGSYLFGNSFIPAVPGSYIITYSLTQNGCTATQSKMVRVQAGPVADAGLDKTICSGDSAQIGAAPVTGMVYNWYPASGLDNPTAANPTVTLSNFSTQNDTLVKILEVTNPATGCVSSDIVKIIVKGVPIVNAGTDKDFCQNQSPQQLVGLPAGGNWSGTTAVTSAGLFDPAAAGAGVHTLRYTITANGCSRTDTMQLTVTVPPVASAGMDVILCSGEPTMLGSIALPNHTYNWSPAAWLSTTTAANPAFSQVNNSSQPDTIWKIVTVTNTLTGCSSIDSVRIIVKGMPVISAGTDTTLCSGSSIFTLNGLPTGGTWSGSTALSGNSFDPASAGIGTHVLAYTYSLNGCTATDSIQILVEATPATPIILPIGSGGLSSSVSGSGYNWLLNGAPTTFTTNNISPVVSGLYQVIVNNNGCDSDTSAVYSFTVTGLPDNLTEATLNIYPNPTKGELAVELDQVLSEKAKVTLFDALGRMVLHQQLVPDPEGNIKEELNLSDLSNGVYLLKVTSEAKTWNRKIIIQH